MENEEIKRLIEEEGLTLEKVIDVVIDINGIIGVGLVTLGDDLNEYCLTKIKER